MARVRYKSQGGGPPLTRWQWRHNRPIAPRRAAIESAFATLHCWTGLTGVRYRGLARNSRNQMLAR
ncbi:transposase [uncultured Sphingomonas sp.]|uniref:transposase n=1 Tax=uncultured Sphingomonas sp. TaxID=158754 RepID=UPI0025F23A0A|nr:transposase [uncultured Sphingomonas sp.]